MKLVFKFLIVVVIVVVMFFIVVQVQEFVFLEDLLNFVKVFCVFE